MVCLAFALLPVSAVPTELDAYLRREDAAFAILSEAKRPDESEVRFVSQRWQGNSWRHTLVTRRPADYAGDTAVLFITGDGPRPEDLNLLRLVTGAVRMPVAMLFDIPNQPIWGLKEDDLIAHTFTRYLATGQADWPLLFPMTKAALRAMDVVQKTAPADRPIRRFIVAGASKRGWTTWFVGVSGDRRVAGIAPMVYDNLDLRAQMANQLKTLGGYSVMIQEYTKRGLQGQMDTARGRELTRMVDPFSYRSRLRAPVLVVNGSNDPYWTADSTGLYYDHLPDNRRLLTVPNVGHNLGGGLAAIETIGAFARSIAAGSPLANLRGRVRTTESTYLADTQLSGAQRARIRIWVARSKSQDFRTQRYEVVADRTGTPAEVRSIPFRLEGDDNAAVFVEARFESGGAGYSLSTPTQIFVRNRPRK
jgi:PhoPQ-activated pathogenicity-related protein